MLKNMPTRRGRTANRLSPLKRLALVLTTLAAAAFALPTAPAHAGVTGGWTPDPWLYCYNSLVQPGWGWNVSYAGIYSNPYYNSYYTNCRDLWRGDNGYWYSARRVDWYRACQMTYGRNSSSYTSNGRVYCWRW